MKRNVSRDFMLTLEGAAGAIVGFVIWWELCMEHSDYYLKVIKLTWDSYNIWKTGISPIAYWQFAMATSFGASVLAACALILTVSSIIETLCFKFNSRNLESVKEA